MVKMPENPMKAIAMMPVMMKLIAVPDMPAGSFVFAIFSRMAASISMASHQPRPEPLVVLGHRWVLIEWS